MNPLIPNTKPTCRNSTITLSARDSASINFQTRPPGYKPVERKLSPGFRSCERKETWSRLDKAERDFMKALSEQFGITFDSGSVRDE